MTRPALALALGLPLLAAHGGGDGRSSLDLMEADDDAGALDEDNVNR